MIVMPITKRMEVVMLIQVCLISRMNFDFEENGGKKLFLQIQSINIVYPNMENMIVMPTKKRMAIVMRIQVCLISRTNINYEENSGKKAFLINPKHQYRVS